MKQHSNMVMELIISSCNIRNKMEHTNLLHRSISHERKKQQQWGWKADQRQAMKLMKTATRYSKGIRYDSQVGSGLPTTGNTLWGLSETRQRAAAVSPAIVVTCTWTHGQVQQEPEDDQHVFGKR